MRFAGCALLIVGLLLCVTISWAAIGFLAMSFGLICLLIADERKRSAKVEALRKMPKPSYPPLPMVGGLGNEWARQASRWEDIVENDSEIAGIVKVLSGYGQQYVDRLAKVYVIFDDKVFLPKILDLIITSAKRDQGLTNDQQDPSGKHSEKLEPHEEDGSNLSEAAPLNPVVPEEASNEISPAPLQGLEPMQK